MPAARFELRVLLLALLVVLAGAALLGSGREAVPAAKQPESTPATSRGPHLLGAAAPSESVGAAQLTRPPTDGPPCPDLSSLRWVRVLDVRGDRPLADFRLLVADREVRTDEQGMIPVPPAAPIRLPDGAHEHWHLAAVLTQETESRLYVLPLVEVNVVATYEDFASGQGGSSVGALRASFPWNQVASPVAPRLPETSLRWPTLRRANLDSVPLGSLTPNEQGVARTVARVPAIDGFVLTLETPGWLEAWTAMGVPAEDRLYRLTVRRTPRLMGRLVDDQGRPMGGASLRAHFYMVGHRDKLPLDQAFLRIDTGGGIVCAFDRNTGEGSISFDQRVQTGSDGRFSFFAPLEGMNVDVLALPPEHVAAVASRSNLLQDVDDLEISAARPPPDAPGVRIRVRGQFLTSTRVSVTDVTNPHAQSTFVLTTDADGAASTHWLLPGRAYVVRHSTSDPSRSFGGVLVWRHQPVIEVDALEPYPAWLERQ